MAVRQGTQNVPISSLRVTAFSGGMNTSGNARDIAPNECSLVENLEFDDLDNLVTRNGLTQAGVGTTGPTTSLFSFNSDSGFIGALFTSTTNLFSSTIGSAGVAGVLTNITGGLTLPSGARWYWKQLGNVAVGVNGSTGAGNPIQVVGPAPGTASHLAAAPDGKFIEEWNSRLVIAHVSNPSRIQLSDLGTATVWNTDGATNPAHGLIIDVGPGDGDVITALFSFKERLFIFKKKRIYVLRAVALPNTDPNSWEVVEYSKILGCVNQATVREVFDDVVFLSEGGLASLAAAEVAADFASALISAKISEIQRIKKDAAETSILGFALTDRSQYWLIVDSTASPLGANTLWVMDYKQIRTKGIRWTTFSGIIFPTAMDLYNGGGQSQQTYLMGVDTTPGFMSLSLYRPNTPVKDRIFTDTSANTISRPIISRIHTKAFDFDLDEIRKLFQQWYLRFNTISNKAHFKISYEMDDPLSPMVNYDFDTYKTGPVEKLVRQAFKHDVQTKSVSCRFIITVGGKALNQGVSIKNFGIRYGTLNERRSESVLITTTIKNVPYTIDRNRTILGNIGGGQDLVYNFPLPFDSLKTDGDYVDIESSGFLATNDNNKEFLLKVEGDPVTGTGGTQVAGITGGTFDFDGAADRNSWGMRARLMRIDATHLAVMSQSLAGQFLADGAGTFSNTNGIAKADTKTITVANLNLNDMTIQVLVGGVANDDVTHRMTTVQLNQQ